MAQRGAERAHEGGAGLQCMWALRGMRSLTVTGE